MAQRDTACHLARSLGASETGKLLSLLGKETLWGQRAPVRCPHGYSRRTRSTGSALFVGGRPPLAVQQGANGPCVPKVGPASGRHEHEARKEGIAAVDGQRPSGSVTPRALTMADSPLVSCFGADTATRLANANRRARPGKRAVHQHGKIMSDAPIVVAGATGNLGTRALRKRDARVTALVRRGATSAKVEPLRALGVTMASVDLSDQSEVAAACAGFPASSPRWRDFGT